MAARPTDYPFDTGRQHVEIDTGVASCQTWFNRGVAWTAGFHREEANFCFGQARLADPDCAMAAWGVALVNGPDYNFHEKSGFYVVAAQADGFPSLRVASDAVGAAVRCCDGRGAAAIRPAHAALCRALAVRYEWPLTDTTAALQQSYADAMEKVAAEFPEDPLVQAACADAVLCLSPWRLYEAGGGGGGGGAGGAGGAGGGVEGGGLQAQLGGLNEVGRRAKVALDRGLRCLPVDPWLCHLKVHFNEMGPVDRFDWPAANSLRPVLGPSSSSSSSSSSCSPCKSSRTQAGATSLVGADVGHLLHMPTHLDIQVGDYASAVRWNRLAYEADLRVFAAAPERCTAVYRGYLVHNIEFAAWAAMYAGQRAMALEAAAKIDEVLTEADLRANPARVTYFELYRSTRLMVLVRFGMWKDVLETPFLGDYDGGGDGGGKDASGAAAAGAAGAATSSTTGDVAGGGEAAKASPDLFQGHRIFLHFARGVAMAALGDLAGAREQQAAFEALLKGLADGDRVKHNVSGRAMALVAQDVLAAEIFYRAGEHEAAFARLRHGIERSDALPYDEPQGWLMSVRQTLGALLTEQGRYEEACGVYREDLAAFPDNIWSLVGLSACYEARSDPRAKSLKPALDRAQALADVPIRASCACALESWNKSGTASL